MEPLGSTPPRPVPGERTGTRSLHGLHRARSPAREAERCQERWGCVPHRSGGRHPPCGRSPACDGRRVRCAPTRPDPGRPRYRARPNPPPRPRSPRSSEERTGGSAARRLPARRVGAHNRRGTRHFRRSTPAPSAAFRGSESAVALGQRGSVPRYHSTISARRSSAPMGSSRISASISSISRGAPSEMRSTPVGVMK